MTTTTMIHATASHAAGKTSPAQSPGIEGRNQNAPRAIQNAPVARIHKPPMFLWARLLEPFPAFKQWAFLRLYQFLARFDYSDWTTMNYGYESVEFHWPTSVSHSSNDDPERRCFQLYEKVLRGVNLFGKSLLEVGCGRGGGLAWLHGSCGPSMSRGIDISQKQVEFCRRRHMRDTLDLWFHPGSDVAIPFDDNFFDVVLNVESSHCYPSRLKFFREVHRVLKPGGTFCFADLHYHGEAETISLCLAYAGLRIVEQEDLTPGVLLAMELDDERKRYLIQSRAPFGIRRLFGCFAGLKGSRVYRSFEVGARQYTRWRAVK